MKHISQVVFFFFIATIFISCFSDKGIEVSGELKKWHRVTLVFEGPETSELAEENPFVNYRLDVTFTHTDTAFVVTGFFAADGNAAETSAGAGNILKQTMKN